MMTTTDDKKREILEKVLVDRNVLNIDVFQPGDAMPLPCGVDPMPLLLRWMANVRENKVAIGCLSCKQILPCDAPLPHIGAFAFVTNMGNMSTMISPVCLECVEKNVEIVPLVRQSLRDTYGFDSQTVDYFKGGNA